MKLICFVEIFPPAVKRSIASTKIYVRFLKSTNIKSLGKRKKRCRTPNPKP